MRSRSISAVVVLSMGLAAGCGSSSSSNNDPPDGGESCTVVPPATWSAPDFSTNAAAALALRERLDELVGTMRDVEQGAAALAGIGDLTALYEAGSPSVASVTTPTYDAVVADSFADFVALAATGAGDPIDDAGLWMPGPDGGIFGDSARGLNAGGIESRQIVDKGLFAGGAFYGFALQRTQGAIDAATIDTLAAAWGANAELDPAGDLTDSASYSFQMGFFDEIASALIDAKAFAASEACTSERDTAIRSFFRSWEQSMLARAVYYANRGSDGVALATSDNDLIEALHLLAEGAGLALGYRGVNNPTSGPLAGAARTIVNADIEAIMAALGVDVADQSASVTGLFVEDAAAFADAVLDVEAVVARVYGLSAEEIASYRDPSEG